MAISVDKFIAGLVALARDLQSPRERQLLLQQMGAIMVDEGIRNITEGHTPAGVPFLPLAFARPSGGGGGPLDNTGGLVRSLRAVVSGSRVGVTSIHPGAALHQHGGIVAARRVQFLTIPLTAVAAAAGGARQFPGRLHPRIKKGSDRGALVDDAGTAQYALRKSVFIPARPFLGPGPRVDARLLALLERWYLPRFPGDH